MKEQGLKVIITTGGTGGHVFPALAFAKALQKKHEAQVLFVGANYGREREYATRDGLEFYGLDVFGLKGRGFRAIGAGFKMLKAIFTGYRFLGKYKPHAVVGFGGYACFAMVLAAKLRKIPCIIHEQNAVPGLANKILGRFVDRVCLSLPDIKGKFNSKKTVLTGNPIRSEIVEINPEYKEKINQDKAQRQLLIMGGSLGATAINSLAIGMLGKLKQENIKLVHQCGPKDYERVSQAYKAFGYNEEEINEILFAFIDDMPTCYAESDLALCRAGASSIAELTATGTPAIFIPFPSATDDHQTANAENLVKNGAAFCFAEKDVCKANGEIDLVKIVLDLLADGEKLSLMSKKSYQLAKIEAAENLIQVMETILKDKNYA